MMYWNKHPDGSMTRKLVEDWTPEERELHDRHEAFLKEASALGYRFRTDIDTQEWIGRFAREWVGLTSEEIDILHRTSMDAVDQKGWGFLNHERFGPG